MWAGWSWQEPTQQTFFLWPPHRFLHTWSHRHSVPCNNPNSSPHTLFGLGLKKIRSHYKPNGYLFSIPVLVLTNTLLQERDAMIQEEIARLEKLQKLAEKIHQEAKMTDTKLDDIEAWIEDEAKRIDQLHPKDAKNNCDQIERELARTEEVIKSMFSDVQIPRDNRFSQAQDLHRR